jgi:hypothetical protein
MLDNFVSSCMKITTFTQRTAVTLFGTNMCGWARTQPFLPVHSVLVLLVVPAATGGYLMVPTKILPTPTLVLVSVGTATTTDITF